MRSRPLRLASLTLAALALCSVPTGTQSITINGHPLLLDSSGDILAWPTDQATAYDQVLALNTTFLTTGVPTSGGLPLYLLYSYIDPDSLSPANHPHNPAGLYGMLTDSGLPYFAYSGDPAMANLVGTVLTYDLDHGLTASTANWPSVPYASADSGATTYQGSSSGNSDGNGDGFGVIEPDKIGEIGIAFLHYYEFSGQTRFRDAAMHAADVLASHRRAGTAAQSPWPFRVYADTNVVREDYCANVIGAIRLFDELIRLGLGDTASYQAARDGAWTWLMTYPMQNNVWANYFEDIPIQSNLNNVDQYVPAETARYLLQHPEMDPSWESHVRGIIAWIEQTFAQPQYGAMRIAEQNYFLYVMGSHTSRYASINAMLAEVTGDEAAREKARLAFNWATYMCRTNGRTIVGPDVNQMWWTDGFGDYIRHFLAGLGAQPDWAPPGASHLLRSTSIVRTVQYASDTVSYTTFDGAATEVLRLAFTPQTVTADGVLLHPRADLAGEGWTYDPGTNVLRVRHDTATSIGITSAKSDDNQPPVVALTSPPEGTAYTALASVPLDASAGDSDGTVAFVDFLANGMLIGRAVSPFAFTWSDVPAGTYTLTAQAVDDLGARTASAPVQIVVDAPVNLPPSVSITSPAPNATFVAPATIPVVASATDQDGSIAKVEFLLDNAVFATDTTQPYGASANNVIAGSHTLTARATDSGGAVTTSAPVPVTVTNGSLPAPWQQADVGSVNWIGSGSESGGVFTVSGDGIDIWDTADAFHFVYQQLSGDGEIRARVVSMQNTDPWALAGVMFRSTLAAGSREAVVALTPGHGASVTWRPSTNGVSSYRDGGSASAPLWLRLVRQGTTVRAYRSANGSTWTQITSLTLSLSTTAYVGLAVTSHNTSLLNTAVFDNVSVTGTSDTTAPTVSVTSPTAGAVVSGSVTVRASASDNVGVAGVQFTLDGASLGAEDTATPYSVSWNTTTATNGTHVLSARARDAAGNTTTATNVSVTVNNTDTTAPTVSITSPTAGAAVSGTITVTATASDNVGVAGVQFTLDGANLGVEDTATPYSVSWNTATVANGLHTLGARARDAAGNQATATIQVTVNNGAAPGLVLALGFNENTGSTTADASGMQNNGTLSNTTWTSGRYGTGLSFNGSSSRVTVADAATLHLTSTMTLEAWVRPTALKGWTTVLLKERSGGLSYALYATDDTGRPPAGYVSINGDTQVVGTSRLASNTWTHLAMTYDGMQMRLYVNGALVATRQQAGSTASSTSPLRIGSNAVWGEYFTGVIDEVRIYNRALSASEIATDMNTPIQ